MDGVWLPAGEENPGTRGFPDSRPKPGPGIAKGEAFSPLVRPRQQQVGKSPKPTRAEPVQPFPTEPAQPFPTEPAQPYPADSALPFRQRRDRSSRIRLRAESPSIQSAWVDAPSTLNKGSQMIHLLRQQTGGQVRILRIHLQAAVAKQ